MSTPLVSTGVNQFYSQATSVSRSGQQTSKGQRRGSTGAALGASPDLKGEKNAQPSEQASPVATARSRSPLPPASAKSSDPVPTEGEKAREMLHAPMSTSASTSTSASGTVRSPLASPVPRMRSPLGGGAATTREEEEDGGDDRDSRRTDRVEPNITPAHAQGDPTNAATEQPTLPPSNIAQLQLGNNSAAGGGGAGAVYAGSSKDTPGWPPAFTTKPGPRATKSKRPGALPASTASAAGPSGSDSSTCPENSKGRPNRAAAAARKKLLAPVDGLAAASSTSMARDGSNASRTSTRSQRSATARADKSVYLESSDEEKSSKRATQAGPETKIYSFKGKERAKQPVTKKPMTRQLAARSESYDHEDEQQRALDDVDGLSGSWSDASTHEDMPAAALSVGGSAGLAQSARSGSVQPLSAGGPAAATKRKTRQTDVAATSPAIRLDRRAATPPAFDSREPIPVPPSRKRKIVDSSSERGESPAPQVQSSAKKRKPPSVLSLDGSKGDESSPEPSLSDQPSTTTGGDDVTRNSVMQLEDDSNLPFVLQGLVKTEAVEGAELDDAKEVSHSGDAMAPSRAGLPILNVENAQSETMDWREASVSHTENVSPQSSPPPDAGPGVVDKPAKRGRGRPRKYPRDGSGISPGKKKKGAVKTRESTPLLNGVLGADLHHLPGPAASSRAGTPALLTKAPLSEDEAYALAEHLQRAEATLAEERRLVETDSHPLFLEALTEWTALRNSRVAQITNIFQAKEGMKRRSLEAAEKHQWTQWEDEKREIWVDMMEDNSRRIRRLELEWGDNEYTAVMCPFVPLERPPAVQPMVRLQVLDDMGGGEVTFVPFPEKVAQHRVWDPMQHDVDTDMCLMGLRSADALTKSAIVKPGRHRSRGRSAYIKPFPLGPGPNAPESDTNDELELLPKARFLGSSHPLRQALSQEALAPAPAPASARPVMPPPPPPMRTVPGVSFDGGFSRDSAIVVDDKSSPMGAHVPLPAFPHPGAMGRNGMDGPLMSHQMIANYERDEAVRAARYGQVAGQTYTQRPNQRSRPELEYFESHAAAEGYDHGILQQREFERQGPDGQGLRVGDYQTGRSPAQAKAVLSSQNARPATHRAVHAAAPKREFDAPVRLVGGSAHSSKLDAQMARRDHMPAREGLPPASRYPASYTAEIARDPRSPPISHHPFPRDDARRYTAVPPPPPGYLAPQQPHYVHQQQQAFRNRAPLYSEQSTRDGRYAPPPPPPPPYEDQYAWQYEQRYGPPSGHPLGYGHYLPGEASPPPPPPRQVAPARPGYSPPQQPGHLSSTAGYPPHAAPQPPSAMHVDTRARDSPGGRAKRAATTSKLASAMSSSQARVASRSVSHAHAQSQPSPLSAENLARYAAELETQGHARR